MKTNSTNETPIWTQYALDVVAGRVVTGDLIKLACQRYLDDINSDTYELRDDVVRRVIDFMQLFKHFKGKIAGQHYVVEPWQSWIVANLYGIYYKGTDKRKYNEAYIEVARKNAKTFLTAAMGMYSFVADGVAGAEVMLLATSREQAKIAFEDFETFSKQIDPNHQVLKLYRDRIKIPQTNSMVLVCSSDDSKLDGRFPSWICCDEFHAHKTNALRSVMKSGMTRPNALLVTITTAGFSLVSPCYKLRQSCVDILYKNKTDEATFAAIFCIDENDQWDDPEVWIKANPNIGKSVDEDYIQRQIVTAKNNVSEEVAVKTKTLNLWLSTSSVWIPDSYINKCTQTINLDDFNEDSECWVGCDLAAVGDMTAVTFMLFKEDDDTPYFHTKYYLPESALVESPNRELYKYWARTKQLTVCAGNVTDYDYITNDIMAMYNRFNVRKIAYDSWNSTQWAIKATELGLPLEPFSQSIGNFNKGTREFERLIRQSKCVIDNNEITRWMFRNVAIKADTNGNIKPNKGAGAEKKIDGIISQITALGKWLETPRFSGSILAL